MPPRSADQATDVSLHVRLLLLVCRLPSSCSHQPSTTCAQLVKYRLALEQRKFKTMTEGDQPFSYEAVAAIDANYRCASSRSPRPQLPQR